MKKLILFAIAIIAVTAISCSEKKGSLKEEAARFREDIKKQIVAMDDKLNRAEHRIKSLGAAQKKLAQDEINAMRANIAILKEKAEHFNEVAENEWADFSEKMRYSAYALAQGINALADRIKPGKAAEDEE